MKILFLFVVILIQASNARKKSKIWQSGNREETSSYKNLDMRGTLRKSFFVVNALEHLHNNTICSPISALLPLGKLALGAEDTSLDELLTAIGIIHLEKLKAHFKYLIAEMRYLPGVKLNVASRLYIGLQTKLLSKFNRDATDVFTSSAERVDFEAPVLTAENINSWVESQTNDMIQDMISPDDISPDTSLVLVNAVYFFGKWEDPFTNIKTSTFHTPTDVRRITMMSKTAHLNYTNSESLDAKILKIPYNGGKASFIIVLPNAKNGLPLLLSQIKLAPEILDSALGSLTSHSVYVTMPKFKIEGESDLRILYERIGVKRIFNQYESGLNGIVKEKKLFVSRAKQKAIIDVNEYGTEAAAASAIVVSKLSLEKTIQFRADHPFLFFVLSGSQQLFAGTLVHPPVAK